ncbi:MAG: hypothetical protein FD174_27 [Geobacteraceae bacterium]|nr:MAG: hypothetical protein FD174_27 [Geobacteraceae bacterium]
MPRTEPQRSCLGCREVKDKKDLLRFVLAPDRTLVPDLLNKLPGRGAYTCMSKLCLKAAADRKQFARSYRGEVKHAGADELVNQVALRLEERIVSYLALANKAGKVVSGSDMVAEALRKRSPGVLFIAADISPEIGQKFAHLACKSGVPCFNLLDKGRLGALLGKELRSVAAIEQSGFVETITRELKRYRNFFEGGTQSQ